MLVPGVHGKPGLRMVKILHVADLHLGWEPRFLGPRAVEWQRERDGVFSAVVDYALMPGSGIGLVLIVGDLFDSHTPAQPLVDEVLRQIKRLVERGIQVVTVPGNHDEITYPDSVYRREVGAWPGILVQNPNPEHVATLDVGGEKCQIYSLAYTGGLTKTDPPIQEFPRSDKPGWHIAAFHGSLNWNTGDRSLPLSGPALGRAGYDYVALGHIHKPGTYPLGKGLAVYPGSLAAKGWSDPGSGQVTVATLSGGKVELEKVPLNHPACRSCRTLEVDVGQYLSAGDLIAALKAGLRKDEIACISLTGTAGFPVDPEEVKGALTAACYHLEVVDQTDSYSPHMLAAWAKESTLRGYFVRRMEERLAAAMDERERRLVARALLCGLKALRGEGR